jgi:hypothetical protein
MYVRVLLLVIALSAPALAYLDPVTGNILVQGLLAGVAAVALAYHRIKAYARVKLGLAPAEDKAQPEPETAPSEADDSADAGKDTP